MQDFPFYIYKDITYIYNYKDITQNVLPHELKCLSSNVVKLSPCSVREEANIASPPDQGPTAFEKTRRSFIERWAPCSVLTCFPHEYTYNCNYHETRLFPTTIVPTSVLVIRCHV